MADYYKMLGVPKTASPDDIKKAFRKLAHQHHPDKGGGDEAKFKEINEAYQVLSNKEKREQYDRFGQTFNDNGAGQGGRQGFGGFDFSGFSSQGGPASGFDFNGAGFEDIFAEMFGSGQSRRRGQTGAGTDIGVDIEISFEEMVRGAKRAITLRKLSECLVCKGSGGKPSSKEETCRECHGEGRVRRNMQSIFGAFSQVVVCDHCRGKGKTYSESCKTCDGDGRVEREETFTVEIPAGVHDEQVVSMPGYGASGEHGNPSGTLYITVHLLPHAMFKRRGDDIISSAEISFSHAVLGDSVSVETIDGMVQMKIPAGTQPGEVFRIKGKGVPHLGSYGRGNQLVHVTLKVPKKLSSEAKKVIESLRDIENRAK